MAGFAPIGIGIGGFMSGAESGANSVMGLLTNLQKLQEMRRQQQARALITQALSQPQGSPLSSPAITGTPGLGMGSGAGLPTGGAPQPPMPGAPSQPAPQPQASGSPYYPALTAQPQPAAPQSAAAPILEEGQGPDAGIGSIIPGSPVMPPQPALGGASAASGTPPASGDAGGAAAPATSTPSAPQPPAPAQQVVQSAQPGDFIVSDPKTGQSFNFSQLLHKDSFADIVQRIKKARPDADDTTVEMAAERLYTLANQGDKMQQLGALATLKYLGMNAQIASRENIAGAQIAGRAANVATQQAGANERAQLGANTREDIATKNREAAAARGQAIQDRIDARFNQSIEQRKISGQQKQQAQMVANSYKNIMTQIAAIKAKSAGGVTGPSPEDQTKLQALQDQAVKLYGQLRGMGLAIDSPAALLNGGDQAAPTQ